MTSETKPTATEGAPEIPSPPPPVPSIGVAARRAPNLKTAKAAKAGMTKPEPAKTAVGKKVSKDKKTVKKAKPKKIKMVRDSFTMPEHEYAQIAALKKKCGRAGVPVKKSELLRVGLSHLSGLSDAALMKAVAGVERLKTGRPTKHK